MLHASRITSALVVGFLALGLVVGCSLVTDWDQVSLDELDGGRPSSRDGGGNTTSSSGTSSGDEDTDPSPRPGDDGGGIVDDDAGDASFAVDAGVCVANALRCASELGLSGIKLYRCNAAGTADLAAVCKRTCHVSNPGIADLIGATEATCDCISGGLYCGGDQVVGDPTSLYKCLDNRMATLVRTCTTCVVNTVGKDDVCNP